MADPADTPAPVTSAREAAEAIEVTCRLTLGAELARPSDLYDTVTALARMAESLPQALRQMERIARTFGRADIADDRDPRWDARNTALDGADRITAGADYAEQMAASLRAAANELSHLGVRE